MSVIGYRDFNYEVPFEILPFTENIDEVKKFIAKINVDAKTIAEDDIPEDIAGAFERALEQNWQSKIKQAILITDAPCHGRMYHSSLCIK